MIELKSWAYQNNNTELVATVDYDYPKNSGIMFTFYPMGQVSQLLTMTTPQVTTWVINQVTSRRGQMEQQAVDEILVPIQNVDIDP